VREIFCPAAELLCTNQSKSTRRDLLALARSHTLSSRVQRSERGTCCCSWTRGKTEPFGGALHFRFPVGESKSRSLARCASNAAEYGGMGGAALGM